MHCVLFEIHRGSIRAVIEFRITTGLGHGPRHFCQTP